MLAIILLYAILAGSFALGKNAVAYSGPCFLIGFRMILAGACILAYQYLYNKKEFSLLKKKHLVPLFITALFHIYFAFILEFWALQYVTALKTVLIYSLTPFFCAGFAYFLENEKLTRLKIFGMIIGCLGLAPVILSQTLTETNKATGLFSISLPEAVLFVAVLSAAYAWFRVKDLMGEGFHYAFVNGSTMLIGGILSLLTSFAVEGFTPPVTAWGPFLFWTISLIIFANIIFYNLYGYLMKSYSITLISFAGFLSPIFATFFEWQFMSGVVTWHHFVCLTFVTFGLYLFYQDELRLPNHTS